MKRLVRQFRVSFAPVVFAAQAAVACTSDGARPAPTASTGGGASGDGRAGSTSTGGSTADVGTFDTSGGPTDPIPTKPLEWVWVPFSEAKCRDGSIAGIEVNRNPASDNLYIYLEGGGSCWNPVECAANPHRFDPPEHFTLGNGAFDRANAANPVKDWNMVYVPYCTGDVHAGSNPDFDPGGGIGPQQFVGYTNIEKFLDRLVPTFPSVKKILYTGTSAGGAGALLTVELVGKKFPSSVDLIMIDDSAPPISTAFLPACIQRKKWTMWGFDKTFLRDCGADCPDPDNYLFDYARHVSRAYPGRRAGLVESASDFTILSKYGYTASDCNGDITQAPAPMDPAKFETALLDLRSQMAALVPDGGSPNFGTFFPPGLQHGWLTNGDTLYTGSAGGEKLIDWLSAMVDGAPPTNVGP